MKKLGNGSFLIKTEDLNKYENKKVKILNTIKLNENIYMQASLESDDAINNLNDLFVINSENKLIIGTDYYNENEDYYNENENYNNQEVNHFWVKITNENPLIVLSYVKRAREALGKSIGEKVDINKMSKLIESFQKYDSLNKEKKIIVKLENLGREELNDILKN